MTSGGNGLTFLPGSCDGPAEPTARDDLCQASTAVPAPHGGTDGKDLHANGETVELDPWSTTKAVNFVSSTAFANAMSSFFMGVNLTSAMNYIETGIEDNPNSRSQVWVTVCLIITQALTLLWSEVWARGGGWWGRKRIIVLLDVFLLVAAVISLIGVLVESPFLLVIASIFLGMCTGQAYAALAYVADVSPTSKFSKNVGVLNVWSAVGVIVGMFVIVFADVRFGYVIPVIVVGLIVVAAQLFVPDVSPPLCDRAPCSWASLGGAMVPWVHLKSLRVQTMYTRFLLSSIFFGAASFKTIQVWLFTYGLNNFGLTRTICGLWILCVFATSAGVIGLGTRCVGAKKGTVALMWFIPVFAIWMCVGPAQGYTVFIGLAVLMPNHLAWSLLSTLFYGQQPPARRAELAGLNNIADKLGGLFGLAVVSPLTVAWLKAKEDGDDRSVPPPPMLQAIFEALAALSFYIAWKFYSHEDQLLSGEETVHIPAAGEQQADEKE